MAIISYLTTIRFGFGEVANLKDDLAELGIRKPLVVADAGVVKAGLVERVVAAVASLRTAPLFEETPTNPTEEAVAAALALHREAGCDGVVAIGGGSPIDLAKGVALLATHEGPLERYAAILGGVPRIAATVAPVDRHPDHCRHRQRGRPRRADHASDGRKLGFISPHLIPKRAICDPELTLGLPPALTAATGMDALAHCIETYLSPARQPAGGGHRPRRACRAIAQHRTGRRERRRPRRAARDDDGGARRRAHLPEGPRRRPLPVARPRRPEGAVGCITAR